MRFLCVGVPVGDWEGGDVGEIVGVFVGVFGARLGPPDGLEEGLKLELGRVVATPPIPSAVSLTFSLLGERSSVPKIPAMTPTIRKNALAIYFERPLRDEGGRLSLSPVLWGSIGASGSGRGVDD
mmetsp:Transcript_33083/g.61018  ORF Transcript_33083/g.61018 Transcript_33083/m.61018 type:complete len:125 (+) Transcript_33083:1745-2119(+)